MDEFIPSEIVRNWDAVHAEIKANMDQVIAEIVSLSLGPKELIPPDLLEKLRHCTELLDDWVKHVQNMEVRVYWVCQQCGKAHSRWQRGGSIPHYCPRLPDGTPSECQLKANQRRVDKQREKRHRVAELKRQQNQQVNP